MGITPPDRQINQVAATHGGAAALRASARTPGPPARRPANPDRPRLFRRSDPRERHRRRHGGGMAATATGGGGRPHRDPAAPGAGNAAARGAPPRPPRGGEARDALGDGRPRRPALPATPRARSRDRCAASDLDGTSLSGGLSRLSSSRTATRRAARGRHPRGASRDRGQHQHLACIEGHLCKLAGPRGRHTARDGQAALPGSGRGGTSPATGSELERRPPCPSTGPRRGLPHDREDPEEPGRPGALADATRKASSIGHTGRGCCCCCCCCCGKEGGKAAADTLATRAPRPRCSSWDSRSRIEHGRGARGVPPPARPPTRLPSLARRRRDGTAGLGVSFTLSPGEPIPACEKKGATDRATGHRLSPGLAGSSRLSLRKKTGDGTTKRSRLSPVHTLAFLGPRAFPARLSVPRLRAAREKAQRRPGGRPPHRPHAGARLKKKTDPAGNPAHRAEATRSAHDRGRARRRRLAHHTLRGLSGGFRPRKGDDFHNTRCWPGVPPPRLHSTSGDRPHRAPQATRQRRSQGRAPPRRPSDTDTLATNRSGAGERDAATSAGAARGSRHLTRLSRSLSASLGRDGDRDDATRLVPRQRHSLCPEDDRARGPSFAASDTGMLEACGDAARHLAPITPRHRLQAFPASAQPPRLGAPRPPPRRTPRRRLQTFPAPAQSLLSQLAQRQRREGRQRADTQAAGAFGRQGRAGLAPSLAQQACSSGLAEPSARTAFLPCCSGPAPARPAAGRQRRQGLKGGRQKSGREPGRRAFGRPGVLKAPSFPLGVAGRGGMRAGRRRGRAPGGSGSGPPSPPGSRGERGCAAGRARPPERVASGGRTGACRMRGPPALRRLAGQDEDAGWGGGGGGGGGGGAPRMEDNESTPVLGGPEPKSGQDNRSTHGRRQAGALVGAGETGLPRAAGRQQAEAGPGQQVYPEPLGGGSPRPARDNRSTPAPGDGSSGSGRTGLLPPRPPPPPPPARPSPRPAYRAWDPRGGKSRPRAARRGLSLSLSGLASARAPPPTDGGARRRRHAAPSLACPGSRTPRLGPGTRAEESAEADRAGAGTGARAAGAPCRPRPAEREASEEEEEEEEAGRRPRSCRPATKACVEG
ncbi:collagen alpha-1(I) chain-like [Vidua chalybeata]|uniref:collagen alpha-1(I) chain-like n=1 Tax=Vidua chalybeata TaxID=81927 RepID=UPI0023A7D6EA|nr:collagen alpha-1(I) chain-like [Vidua chalybeata]